MTTYKTYEVQDTICHKVEDIFKGTKNQVYVSGYPTTFYANDDCTYVIGMAYFGSAWQTIRRPIRSFSVLSRYE
ncbi:hypothetical protein GGI16_000994 [Coemansia sp. S142-1]|nr:hypothetical protein GGI16_000994 [Coemansia sp. S142-1]KAJ2352450.1 hypothetical protein GGH92_001255 [Coemansia sp. RSA 2673]